MRYLIISHQSAALMYRHCRINGDSLSYYKNIKKNYVSPISRDLINYMNIPWLDNQQYKLHLVVLSNLQRRHLKNIYVHYYSKKLPNNSFCHINNELLISSPELLFCQLATVLPFSKLLVFGFEICGSYVITNTDGIINFRNNIHPLTSTKKIRKYINLLSVSYKRFSGINQAMEALNIIENNSASPQESNLFSILTAPHKYGGYGLKGFVLNQQLTLSKKASSIAGQNYIVPDISNARNKISIEYDSDMFHNISYQNTRDKRRIDALQHDGWKVYSFVKDQVMNPNILHNMAIDILRDNNQDSRIRMRNFKVRRDNFHKALYFDNYLLNK